MLRALSTFTVRLVSPGRAACFSIRLLVVAFMLAPLDLSAGGGEKGTNAPGSGLDGKVTGAAPVTAAEAEHIKAEREALIRERELARQRAAAAAAVPAPCTGGSCVAAQVAPDEAAQAAERLRRQAEQARREAEERRAEIARRGATAASSLAPKQNYNQQQLNGDKERFLKVANPEPGVSRKEREAFAEGIVDKNLKDHATALLMNERANEELVDFAANQAQVAASARKQVEKLKGNEKGFTSLHPSLGSAAQNGRKVDSTIVVASGDGAAGASFSKPFRLDAPPEGNDSKGGRSLASVDNAALLSSRLPSPDSLVAQKKNGEAGRKDLDMELAKLMNGNAEAGKAGKEPGKTDKMLALALRLGEVPESAAGGGNSGAAVATQGAGEAIGDHTGNRYSSADPHAGHITIFQIVSRKIREQERRQHFGRVF